MGMQDGMDEADPLSLVVIAYFTVAVLMVILWFVQRKTKNAAIGDVGWCVGLIAAVLLYITQAPVGIERIMLTAMLVLMYAGRLGYHLYS